MAGFCGYCGAPVLENAKFCISCGKPLGKAGPRQTAQQPPSRQTPSERAATEQKPQREAAATEQNPKKEAAAVREKKPRETAPQPIPQLFSQMAAASAGELTCGEFGPLADAREAVSEVLSPVKGLAKGAGSFLGGILSAFKKPAALIGVVVLAALWVVLGSLRNSDSAVVKLLSWLSFAEGGLDRSIPGALGGILGKGTVAAALVSLFTGGLKNAGKGVLALFKGRGEKRSLISLAIGVLIGAGLYFVYTGPQASASSTMAGVAGALLSLESLGSGSGRLYELAEALTSRVQNGVRTAVQGRCDGLFTGLTAGFALGAVLLTLI